MSQAHYVLCDHLGSHLGELAQPPAVAAVRRPDGTDWRLCLPCLNLTLDVCDLRSELEPVYLVWTYDAGTRTCPLHHWPDVVCRDWSAEHAALIRALAGLTSSSTGG